MRFVNQTGLRYSSLYTCKVSRLRRDCHACRSKTSISRQLTSVFKFLTPGRNVWAVTRFEKKFLKKLEPMTEKKSPCEWSTFSEFSYFSREGDKRQGRVHSRSCARVRRNSSDIIISEPYKNTGTLRMEMFKKWADISLFIRSFSQK